MFVFHGERCVVGRELVGTKTCGSTLSSACSRSFIAYLAKSAAVAYGELDCSSACTTETALAMRTKAILRFMDLQGGLFLSDFPAFRKAFRYGKTSATGGYNSLKHYLFHL